MMENPFLGIMDFLQRSMTGTPVDRASVLPLARDAQGGLMWAMPETLESIRRIGQSAGGMGPSPMDAQGNISPQAVEDAFNAAGAVTLGAGAMPAEQGLRMGIRAYHGSPQKGLRELRPSQEGTGALGPGVYSTPAGNVARRYGENVYEVENPDNLFLGSGRQWDGLSSSDNPYQIWRDQVKRMVDAAPESQREMIQGEADRAGNDGYSFFRGIAANLGSKEAAQEVFKRAGFDGMSAIIDGPEIVSWGPLRVQNPPPGIRAYHGSPHDFDKFELSPRTIGTGEGAQAYGHGLYFAENPEVADIYKNALGGMGFKDEVVAAKYGPDVSRALEKELRYRTPQEIMDLNKQYEGTGTIMDDMYRALKSGDYTQGGKMYEVNINADPEDFLDWDKPLSEQPAAFYEAMKGRPAHYGIVQPDGNFATSIPLTKEQADEFIADFRGGYARHGGDPDDWHIVDYSNQSEMPSRPIYEGFDLRSPQSAVEMAKAGIPGIRFLDAGSRNTGRTATVNGVPIRQFDPGSYDLDNLLQKIEQGYSPAEVRKMAAAKSSELAKKFDALDIKISEGTRNLVVFDDSLIDIVRKYGWAGLMMPGVMEAMQGQPE